MKKQGIIFDCDGTLVNSLDQALLSFQYALKKVGAGECTPEQIKQHFGAGADRILLAILSDKERALEAFDYFIDHQSELAYETHLHPGVRELLDQLSSEGVPMAIVTGRHARDLEVVLKPHKLADYFVALVADSHLPKSKPAPDGILMAAERMGLLPQNTLYVGDSPTDIQAAHAARSVPVAALWDSLAKPEELHREDPAFMARTPDEVGSFFKTLVEE